MEQIKNTIQQVLEALEKKKTGTDSDDPKSILKKVLAKKAFGHVKLYNFRKGILTVKVDSSVWVYYLNLQKEDLLKKISKETRDVKDIRFCLGD